MSSLFYKNAYYNLDTAIAVFYVQKTFAKDGYNQKEFVIHFPTNVIKIELKLEEYTSEFTIVYNYLKNKGWNEKFY